VLYAALALWLFVILFAAWGAQSLLARVVSPRALNWLLLPGTFVATVGHVVGLLLTGNEVRGTVLMADDPQGAPRSEPPPRQRVPVIGPLVVGLLPLVLCAAGVKIAASLLGTDVIGRAVTWSDANMSLWTTLPDSPAAFWKLLRDTVSAMEQTTLVIHKTDLWRWQTLLFLYLAVCLTVRMAPFAGHRRGAVTAVALTSALVALAGWLSTKVRDGVLESWRLLSFVVGLLLLVLLAALLLNAVVGVVQLLRKNQ
jgi:hypothetical protein